MTKKTTADIPTSVLSTKKESKFLGFKEQARQFAQMIHGTSLKDPELRSILQNILQHIVS